LPSQIYSLRVLSALWLTAGRPAPHKLANTRGTRPSPDARTTGRARPERRRRHRSGSILAANRRIEMRVCSGASTPMPSDFGDFVPLLFRRDGRGSFFFLLVLSLKLFASSPARDDEPTPCGTPVLHYCDVPDDPVACGVIRSQPSWALAGSGGIRASPVVFVTLSSAQSVVSVR
jgi:hypothetical protein